MAFTRLPAGLSIRIRLARSRGARVAAALSAALILATLTGAARQPAVSYPVQAAFTPTGPYATTTGTVSDATGTAIYDLFYPSNYAALGFKSPIVTWQRDRRDTGQGLDLPEPPGLVRVHRHRLDPAQHGQRQRDRRGRPLPGRTGQRHGQRLPRPPGREQGGRGGTSQGATGAVRAATNDPALIKTVMTFSEPNPIWAAPNPDCPTAADCTADPAALTQPASSSPPTDSGIRSSRARPRKRPSSSASPCTRRSASSSTPTANRPTSLNPGHRGRREPRRLPRLCHRLAGIPATRQRHRGRRLHRCAPGTGIEHQLARQHRQVAWGFQRP